MALPSSHRFDPSVLREYDIRGIVGQTLKPEDAFAIGRCFGSIVAGQGGRVVAVGYDGRLSSPAMEAALVAGLGESGIETIRVGRGPTPMLYYAAATLDAGGAIMVTGSHNPPDYNGFKMVIAGNTLSGDAIQALRARIEAGQVRQGRGTVSGRDVAEAYLARITGDIRLSRRMKVAVDCGNGVAGALAPELFRRLGCEVTELFCEVDGTFPNHHPDPSQPANLRDLVAALRSGGELGFAFDGDGDRLGVVTRSGQIIYPDRQLMLFARDILSRHPGAQIIYDVKCSRNLARWISEHGGRPLMWRTGHSLVKAKLKETGAPLAGEMSGHTFFKERWYGFDDGLYAGARLLEILSKVSDIDAVFDALPDSVNTPEMQIRVEGRDHHALIAQLQREATFPAAREVITLDGLRVEYADGFGLVRGSNTTPVLVLRFEADNAAALARIQGEFRQVLAAAGVDAGF